MDHHWRSRPPPPSPSLPHGAICPVCSICHFPFCDSAGHPSSFNQNLGFQFQPHPDPFPHRPMFDAYFDHFGPPVVNPHLRPFCDPRPWHVNPSLDGYPHAHVDPSCVDNSSVGLKRMRVDESENERRLKLIRDHGGFSGGASANVSDKYLQERSGFDKNLGNFDGGEHGNAYQNSNNFEGENCIVGNFDREGGISNQEPGFSCRQGRDNGFVHGQQFFPGHKNVEHNQLQFARTDGYMGGSYKNGVNNAHLDGKISNYVQSQHFRDPGRSRYGDSFNCSSENVQGLPPACSNYGENSFSMENQRMNGEMFHPYAIQHPKEQRHNPQSQPSDMRLPLGDVSVNGHQNFRPPSEYGMPNLKKPNGMLSVSIGTNMGPKASHPAYPPPPMELPGAALFESYASSSPLNKPSSLFPIAGSSSETMTASYPRTPEAHLLSQSMSQSLSNKYLGNGELFPLRQQSLEKPKVIDASDLFKAPRRIARPDHFVIILRGLPGSGKSYLAKMLRDMEVENGGDAPRIYSMDDYFMTEVEKVEETEPSKSSGRGKKPVIRKVMEYCYEPELEEAYRSSMLKAFKKTLDEGVFSFIIVDDRNLRVADFAQFWATAKRSGYEVYLLEAPYKDPIGCAARNVHGFSQDDIQQMLRQWEEAPSLYMKLDIRSLVHGDELEENKIQEVDMDIGDGEPTDGELILHETNPKKEIISSQQDVTPKGTEEDDTRDHPTEVKDLGRSKWSNDLDDDDFQLSDKAKGGLGALSGLVQVYGKESKSVRWGDKVGHTGFLIGAARKANTLSLVIGPGCGYNLKSNPLPEGDEFVSAKGGGTKRQNVFQEQLRAERESFKAVFDRRRQRVHGLDFDDD